jgi:hypothetical protein
VKRIKTKLILRMFNWKNISLKSRLRRCPNLKNC